MVSRDNPFGAAVSLSFYPVATGAVLTGGGGLGGGTTLAGAAGGPIGLAITGGIAGFQLISNQLKAIAVRNQQKTASTRCVDEIEPFMDQNKNEYLAGPRVRSRQQAALANFDLGWAEVERCCGRPELGQPGVNCIVERGPGGEVPGTGGNWFVWYRDPIANDPTVTDDTAGGLLGILGGGQGDTSGDTGGTGKPGLGTLALIGLGALAVKRFFF
jgi:hypothetical protein